MSKRFLCQCTPNGNNNNKYNPHENNNSDNKNCSNDGPSKNNVDDIHSGTESLQNKDDRLKSSSNVYFIVNFKDIEQ